MFPLLPSCRLSLVCLHSTPGAGSFAYVDFATLDAKKVAITMSESPLDGRRLLIKDGAQASSFFRIPRTTLLIPGAQATVLKVAP